MPVPLPIRFPKTTPRGRLLAWKARARFWSFRRRRRFRPREIIARRGVEVIGKTPAQCKWSLEELSQFSAVLIEMFRRRSWYERHGNPGVVVEETGSGLAMTGGQKSYGPGGYFKSPLERVMPVSMELRREHRKLSVAVVVALDRSAAWRCRRAAGERKLISPISARCRCWIAFAGG